MSTAVSAKIPEELKKKADLYGVKIGKLVREALEEKIRTIEEQMLSSKLDELSGSLASRIKRQDITRAVRASRDER